MDRRRLPARPDLAARALEGRVAAPRYADPVVMRVIDGTAPVRGAPRPDAPLDTEALHGERVDVYEIDAEGFAWGQLAGDGYVGYLPAEALLAEAGQPSPTHRVHVLRCLVYPGPDIKLPPVAALPFGARVAPLRREGRFALLPGERFVIADHLVGEAGVEADPVAVAARFLGLPYQWGGKTALGLDCSALVQVALTACGIACPRDSDMQAAEVGETVATGGLPDDLRRGDLVFWKGHVAMVEDPSTLIHASGHQMLVVREPLAVAVARIAAAGTPVLAVRRPPAAGSP